MGQSTTYVRKELGAGHNRVQSARVRVEAQCAQRVEDLRRGWGRAGALRTSELGIRAATPPDTFRERILLHDQSNPFAMLLSILTRTIDMYDVLVTARESILELIDQTNHSSIIASREFGGLAGASLFLFVACNQCGLPLFNNISSILTK